MTCLGDNLFNSYFYREAAIMKKWHQCKINKTQESNKKTEQQRMESTVKYEHKKLSKEQIKRIRQGKTSQKALQSFSCLEVKAELTGWSLN